MMKTHGLVHKGGSDAAFKWFQTVPYAVVGLLVLATFLLAAQDKKEPGAVEPGKDQGSVGFILSKEPSAKEVGLPLYPGARPHKDSSDESSGVHFGMWGGSSGFKLVVLKLESNDPPEKVAAFYKKALAKYGRVLNCADSSKVADDKEKTRSSNELNCEDDRPERGELVLKAGTKGEQHIVGIKGEGSRSVFQLIYVEARGSDSSQ
jgi:hypothetical protein